VRIKGGGRRYEDPIETLPTILLLERLTGMKNDAIFPFTRVVAAIVFPVLWAAFIILFFFPDLTGERFAWLIKPHMTSMFIGAGYLGGSWLFIYGTFGKRWHRIQGGFIPITVFTWIMLVDTLLHWDRFSHGTLGFNLWLFLYVVTPFLVPAIWYFNRRTDPGTPEESDILVAPAMTWVLRMMGIGSLIFVAASLLSPAFMIGVWPWTLTPLTARIMAGWIALLGVGALVMASDLRWSSWRVPLECILIWHILVLVATFINAGEFTSGILNWYTLAISAMVVAILILYTMMETRRRKTSPSS
jgi:hypothetical protein